MSKKCFLTVSLRGRPVWTCSSHHVLLECYDNGIADGKPGTTWPTFQLVDNTWHVSRDARSPVSLTWLISVTWSPKTVSRVQRARDTWYHVLVTRGTWYVACPQTHAPACEKFGPLPKTAFALDFVKLNCNDGYCNCGSARSWRDSS